MAFSVRLIVQFLRLSISSICQSVLKVKGQSILNRSSISSLSFSIYLRLSFILFSLPRTVTIFLLEGLKCSFPLLHRRRLVGDVSRGLKTQGLSKIKLQPRKALQSRWKILFQIFLDFRDLIYIARIKIGFPRYK
jgi:hypothetical protein